MGHIKAEENRQFLGKFHESPNDSSHQLNNSSHVLENDCLMTGDSSHDSDSSMHYWERVAEI